MSRGYLVVVGVAAVIMGGFMLGAAGRRLRGTVRAPGTIVRLAGRGTPVVRFTTADGQGVEIVSRLTTDGGFRTLFGHDYLPGHRVHVRYPPGQPERATLDGAAMTWLAPAVILVTGLLMMVGAATGAIGH